MDADAERGEEAAGERAGGDAGRGLAGAGALEHVADVGVAVLLGADQVGVARARQVDLVDLAPRPARGSSAPPSWRSRGWRRGRRSGCRGCGRGARRSGSRPSRSRSSSGRRGRGRAGGAPCRGRAPRGRARGPAGMPSTIATRPGAVRLACGREAEASHGPQGYRRAVFLGPIPVGVPLNFFEGRSRLTAMVSREKVQDAPPLPG